VDAECPSETQVLNDGIERDTNDRTACTATSENDAVGQATSAKEVLRRSNSNGLVGLSVLQCWFITTASNVL
jgi:hypothetical protein